MKPLLAVPKIKAPRNPSNEGKIVASISEEAVLGSESSEKHHSSRETSERSTNEYQQLQLRIFRLTLVAAVFAVSITAIFVSNQAAISLLIGACSGILYLRLLARGIGKLGTTSMSVSKVQLIVPVLLFFTVSRFQELELFPALIGFFLYKLSLIVQFLLEP